VSKEPVSRIYKTHSQITADIENDDIEVGINGLAAFLKEALSKSEEDLKTVTRWIQSKRDTLGIRPTCWTSAMPTEGPFG